MARGVNKVILIGNLGRDPEVRYTPNGTVVANITIATSEGWKDKVSGEMQERTEWHRVVMYQRLAEIVGEYLKKGSKVYIEGRLQTRKWQDKTTGQDKYTTEIIADSMQMLDSKGGGGASSSMGHDGGSSGYDRPAAVSGGMGGGSSAHAMSGNAAPALDTFDDDIPF